QTAQILLDYLAQRDRNRSETKIDRVLGNLSNDGNEIRRSDMIEVFRKLEELGCGRYVEGRHGHPSRFAWSIGLVGVGRISSGESQSIEAMETEEELPETLTHTFHLRVDCPITIELPLDLTTQEAERL